MVLHFFIKDRTYDASLLFYLFPLPIIILIILILSLFLGKKRKYNLILAALLLVTWIGRSFRISFPSDIRETDMEIVFWNASRDNDFELAFSEHESIPDIMILTESNEKKFEGLRLKYPHFYFYETNSEIEIFSKIPLSIIKEETSKFHSTVVSFKAEDINFFVVDVSGSMDVPREWELEFVNSIIKETNKTVVLGDFNVPYESMHLEHIKSNFDHAFSEKGNGFRETWFWNIPLLSLDHIWVSKDLEILKAAKISTLKSDHSMIKAVVRK
ncbi:endonuclease/exonuclease/phosphatase family protein [Flavivirga spongiicola]|uniref:Endonuclease/exonuclease/phosphatase domain-containing protein n=1 Tax=Flavivirga spongiicola TaxID=421621 RepID=A0ABU7XW98_9FLAO|nr:endonuclease/exonuclease/phosphatase family protein [Flavivirga sp. MEBiC05379]MDO5979128.1 hypothetical protein [Flavivirga sp. MEBiC05379]